MEEHREAARLSVVVTEAAQDVPPEAAVVRDVPLAVMAEAAKDVPPEEAVVRDAPLAVVAEAAVVRDVPLAVVAEAAQDVPPEAAVVRDVLLAVVAEAAQDVPPEAAVVRDERLAGLPSVVQPSVAPQVSLLAARLARQQVTLPLRGPEVTTYKGSRSQSLQAGLIEFVSSRPVLEPMWRRENSTSWSLSARGSRSTSICLARISCNLLQK